MTDPVCAVCGGEIKSIGGYLTMPDGQELDESIDECTECGATEQTKEREKSDGENKDNRDARTPLDRQRGQHV